MAQVEGSGTTVPDSENDALNCGAAPSAGGPTMSVPTRSQSGSRNSSRVQLCRSVIEGHGVPAQSIGFGADSQKKLPLDPNLDLRHEEIMVGREE